MDSRFTEMWEKGHVPGSTSMPFLSVLKEDKSFKSRRELIGEFQKFGVTNPESDAVIVGCQIGMGACILNLAL